MEKVAEVLQQIAATIGTTVEALYPHFVERAVVWGWVTVVMNSLCLLGALALIPICKKAWLMADKVEGRWEGELKGVTIVFSVVAFVILFGSGISGWSSAISHIVAPESWAVEHIMGLVK